MPAYYPQPKNSILTKSENHLGKKEALAHQQSLKLGLDFLIDYYFKPLRRRTYQLKNLKMGCIRIFRLDIVFLISKFQHVSI